MKEADLKKLQKKILKIEQMLLKGGYDDKVVDEVVYEREYDPEDRRVQQAIARAKMNEETALSELAYASQPKQEQAYQDMVALSNVMKDKIREVADMNTMGNVKLGLGEAWYQGQGKHVSHGNCDDDVILCPHCKGGIAVKKLKKKLHKRKVRRNAAKGKPAPHPPKFMRAPEKKKPGPKKGGAKSAKQSEWMKYCKAVGKTPEMKGKPWNEVMKKASKLKKKGVDITTIRQLH